MDEGFLDNGYDEVDGRTYEDTDDGTYEDTDDGTYEDTDDGTYEDTDDGTYEDIGDGTYEDTDDGTYEDTDDGTYEDTDDGTYEDTSDETYEDTDDGTYEDIGDGTYEDIGDGTYEDTDDGTYEDTDVSADKNVVDVFDETCDSQEVLEEDESQLSPAKLRELGEKEAKIAQEEAEQWANENGMDRWSDGTPRQNHGSTDNGEAAGAEDTVDDIPPEGEPNPAAVPSGDGGALDSSLDMEAVHTQDTRQLDNDDCTQQVLPVYGNAGLDPYASYPESHFVEYSDQYMDDNAEATENTNARARRELQGFTRLQEEQQAGEEEEISSLEAWRDSNETAFEEHLEQHSNETQEESHKDSQEKIQPSSSLFFSLGRGGR